LGGWAKALTRARYCNTSAFVQGLCACGGLARQGGVTATRCGGELLAILVEDNHTSRDTLK
jgi:hypothetical protein